MGWEMRKKNAYYYKSIRTIDGPRKMYCGRGPAGKAHAARDRINARAKAARRTEQEQVRGPLREADRLWAQIWVWLPVLGDSHMLLAGWYRHGRWRRVKRRPRTRQTAVRPELIGLEDVNEQLRELNRHANATADGAIDALQAFLANHPEILSTLEGLIQDS